MIKKLLTRLIVLGTAGLMGYFVFLSVDTPSLRVEKSDPAPSADPLEMGRGDSTRYRKFDTKGNLITTGTSARTTQTGERDFILEEVKISHRKDGRQFEASAHHMVTEENGLKVMTSDPEDPQSRVVLVETGGIRISTPGPLMENNDGTITTEAPTRFSLGNSSGSCVGLRYRSGEFLEMRANVVLNNRTAEADTRVEADYLMIDDRKRTGLIRRGAVTTFNDLRRTLLLAENIDVTFRDSLSTGSMAMERAVLRGKPANFVWASGDLQASYVDICFEDNGRWAQELNTAPDALFSSETDDGYWFNGAGGSLRLLLNASDPELLTATDPISIVGRRDDGPELSLLGKQGMETEFLDGVVTSTRIFGAPDFNYGTLTGKAGSLRVIHTQQQVLFSGGADLFERAENLRIKGDEVLLTSWDQRDREVFAFKFVEILYALENGGQVLGNGDKLEMKMPREYVKLEGKPARFERAGETIESDAIEVTDIDGDVFNLATDSRVLLTKKVEGGDLLVDAQKMNYAGSKRLLRFEKVLQAVMPGRGEMSCEQLDLALKRGRGRDAVENITAYRDVVFKHTLMEKDGPRKITALADKLILDPAEETAEFIGEDRDVEITSDSTTRARRLIYNLKDGSVIGIPVKQGRTKTTVPLKKKPFR
ncbi:MAG: hypothetical protein QNK37_06205 [Acidobacteriota bacterium]|nr:hypothetical protein [Acidobacteriota bacterium]